MAKLKFVDFGGFTADEIKEQLEIILKDLNLNIKFVKLVNIRKTFYGLRFYIKTRNFLAIGEYDYISKVAITLKQKSNIKSYIHILYGRNDLADNTFCFIKGE